MGTVLTQVEALISDRKIDPKLYQAIMLLNKQLHDISIQIEPLVKQSSLGTGGAVTGPVAPIITFVFTGTTVRFAWLSVSGAAQYEVRKGAVWETATLQFRTVNTSADIDPLLEGSHTFLLKAIDSSGNYSTTATQVVVVVPAIAVVAVTGQVIDNNVLLSWSTPISAFNIKHYEVYRDGVLIGIQTGTFFTRFEVVSGTYAYKIIAVDLAGNRSLDTGTINLSVIQPPDYILYATFVSTLNGIKVNCVLSNGVLLFCVNTTETFEEHFTTRSWSSYQDAHNAGYPLMIQPAVTSGSYEEVKDFGVLLAQTIATTTWNFRNVTTPDIPGIIVKYATSTDGISYSAFTSGASQFLSNFRYLKFRLEFTNANDKGLTELWNLTINLSVKREMDGGFGTASESDTDGTVIAFNKIFKDIDAVDVTPMTTTSAFPVVDFDDVPNPTTFKVLMYDNAGVRITKDFRWIARGIV